MSEKTDLWPSITRQMELAPLEPSCAILHLKKQTQMGYHMTFSHKLKVYCCKYYTVSTTLCRWDPKHEFF